MIMASPVWPWLPSQAATPMPLNAHQAIVDAVQGKYAGFEAAGSKVDLLNLKHWPTSA